MSKTTLKSILEKSGSAEQRAAGARAMESESAAATLEPEQIRVLEELKTHAATVRKLEAELQETIAARNEAEATAAKLATAKPRSEEANNAGGQFYLLSQRAEELHATLEREYIGLRVRLKTLFGAVTRAALKTLRYRVCGLCDRDSGIEEQRLALQRDGNRWSNDYWQIHRALDVENLSLNTQRLTSECERIAALAKDVFTETAAAKIELGYEPRDMDRQIL